MSSAAPRIEQRRRVANILGLAVFALLALLAVAPLAHVVYTVVVNGVKVISKVGLPDFLISPPQPQNPNNPGGIGPVLLGSAMLIALASAIGVSLALFAGVFVAEFRRAGISRLVLVLSLLLVEFPTILVGLYIYAIVVQPMGTYSMLAGALALSLVMMPYVAVQVSEAFRGVPHDLREAAFSLGVSRLKAVYRVILGVARRGIIVGVLIGIAKVAGETAPLLFTIGGAFNRPPTGLTEPGGAIPLLIYEYIQQPGPGYHELAWGASLVLLAIVFTIMVVARLLVKGVRL